MSKARRLHPIASVINTGKRAKRLVIPILAILFSGGRDSAGSLLYAMLASAVIVIFTFISGLLSWYRYTYKMEADELRIEYGIFVRKKRFIPYERIQSMDVTEGILQRLFGLVKVQIETAGGQQDEGADAVLSAITKEEAQIIQEFVAMAKGNHRVEGMGEQGHPSVYHISQQQLIMLSLTSGGVGVVISAVFAVLSQLDDFIPFKKLFGGFETWAERNLIIIAIIVFFGFLISWMIALVGTLLKYANFTVIKAEKDLIISQGLLERRQITIPIKRIQAVKIRENIIRQIFGYATVHVESAGGSVENLEGANVTILPMIKLNQIASVLDTLLPEYCMTTSFTPVPKRALRRYIFRSWSWVVPIAALAIIFLKLWGLLSLLLLVIVTFSAILKYRAAGWKLDGQQLSLRYRTTQRITVLIKKNKLQSLELRESPFQHKVQLCTIEAFVESGAGNAGGTVVDMEKNDSLKVYEWFTREQKNRDSSEE
jgi:putative membrane protein